MYDILSTATFSQALKAHARNAALLNELETKLKRLRENPLEVGGRLHGDLHGYRSTRLAKNYRLIFSINDHAKTVTLEALDHRKDAYE